MKVAHTIEEIPELFDSATREAVAAFGRGECFVEQYLDKARHVEAQVIADQHGNVIVAGTRDCSLQRRFQKLVEEAPAPFLTDDQRHRIHTSAKAICKEAGYYGAGTVEYLVQGDTVSFLEVNTRLQVEHPVTEETAGLDLVLQQFKIANGEHLDLTEDPTPRGHAFEFRINGEDAGRGFLPAPGPVTKFVPAHRPRRADGLRRRNRLGDRRPVRLHARQAHRHRRHPRRGPGPRPPRPRRIPGRRTGHGHPVPPGHRLRPRLHRRRHHLRRLHQVDRNRMGQPDRTVHR
ncbi:biotin carboxylase [Rhodococcus opacus PD630]|nr:biotin carboxylase [Rhodococcus opacus PD630]